MKHVSRPRDHRTTGPRDHGTTRSGARRSGGWRHGLVVLLSRSPVVSWSRSPVVSWSCGLMVLSVLTASAQTTTLTNFPVGTMIPDDDPSGLASAQTVSTPITYLTGVKVTLKVSGTFNGDLYCYLTHGSGHTVLLNRVGRRSSSSLGYGDSGFDVKFDDAATNGDVHAYRLTLNGSNTSPISGALTNVWAPDGRTNSPFAVLNTDPRTAVLSSFNGSAPTPQ